MTLVLVGPGRVGTAVLHAARLAGLDAAVVARQGPFEPLTAPHPGVPVVVATRADDLDDVIRRTAPANRGDLVFLQNGMILPTLTAAGLGDNTQGLIYFAATDRSGVVQPGRPSIFHGRHAAFLAGLLVRAGIPARVETDPEAYRREAATKLCWNLVFGLLGDTWSETVGESAERRGPEIATLVAELCPVLARGFAVPVDPEATRAAVVAYARAIPTFRAGVREPEWRNGWLRRAAAEAGLPVPLHDRLFGACVPG